jgi:malonyl-CoA decarboxylase
LRQDEVDAADRDRLAACAAAYLIHETPADPGDLVARFHLDNGARLERIDLDADLSERRLRESFGVMVNYLYDLASIEARHERFVRGEVAASRPVRALA